MKDFALFLLLTGASISDLRYRKIDNILCLLGAAVGLSYTFMYGKTGALLDSLYASIMVFALLYGFFAIRLIGAGDIKFLMAVASFIGSDGIERSIIPITASAMIIVLCTAVFRSIYSLKCKRDFAASLQSNKFFCNSSQKFVIPMAIPISIGVLLGAIQTFI